MSGYGDWMDDEYFDKCKSEIGTGGRNIDIFTAMLLTIGLGLAFFVPTALVCYALDINVDGVNGFVYILCGIFNWIWIGALINGVKSLRKK